MFLASLVWQLQPPRTLKAKTDNLYTVLTTELYYEIVLLWVPLTWPFGDRNISFICFHLIYWRFPKLIRQLITCHLAIHINYNHKCFIMEINHLIAIPKICFYVCLALMDRGLKSNRVKL